MKSSLKNIAKTPLAALALSLALAGLARAGTLDEVKSLWDPRGMVVFGGYRILNALIAEAEKEEKACEKQPDEPR